MPDWAPRSSSLAVLSFAIIHSAHLEADLALPRVSEVGIHYALLSCRAYASDLANQFRS